MFCISDSHSKTHEQVFQSPRKHSANYPTYNFSQFNKAYYFSLHSFDIARMHKIFRPLSVSLLSCLFALVCPYCTLESYFLSLTSIIDLFKNISSSKQISKWIMVYLDTKIDTKFTNYVKISDIRKALGNKFYMDTLTRGFQCFQRK